MAHCNAPLTTLAEQFPLFHQMRTLRPWPESDRKMNKKRGQNYKKGGRTIFAVTIRARKVRRDLCFLRFSMIGLILSPYPIPTTLARTPCSGIRLPT
jgi:hypothetical protein